MNAKQQAFADLKRLAQTLRGVLDAAQELNDVGSIEQAAEEAKAQLNSVRADIEQDKTVLKQAQADFTLACDKRKADADQYVTDKRAEVDGIVDAAHRQAAAIMAAAGAQADDALREAEKKASQRIKEIEGSKAELDELRERVAKATIDLDQENQKIAKANEALASVKASHQAFIASIGVNK